MPINRTPHTVPNAETDADLQHIIDALSGENLAREMLVDRTVGELVANTITMGIDSGADSAGDRSLIFKVTNTISKILKWKQSTGRMRLENEAGALLPLEVADPSSNSQAATQGWVNLRPGKFIGRRIITATGTYTPTSGTQQALVEMQCAGGAGYVAVGASSQNSCSAGGNSGPWGLKLLSLVGVTSVAVTIGAGGASSGALGGTTSFGSFMTGTGGEGGVSMPTGTAVTITPGQTPSATITGADLVVPGDWGGPGVRLSATQGLGGKGASSRYGSGGKGGATDTASNYHAGDATGFGGGGGGGVSPNAGVNGIGSGSPGLIIVWEFS